jgi:hypothetical protein
VPRALELCILDCLAKSPEHRPQTARELLVRLAAAEQELSPNEVWTDERAHAWWQKNQPPAHSSHPAAGTPSPPGQLRIADAP